MRNLSKAERAKLAARARATDISEEEDRAITAAALSDPDNPPLTDEDFAKMQAACDVAPDLVDLQKGLEAKRRGRPKAEETKVLQSLRLSPRVITHFKAHGAGWQTRINDVLEEYVTRVEAEADDPHPAVRGTALREVTFAEAKPRLSWKSPLKHIGQVALPDESSAASLLEYVIFSMPHLSGEAVIKELRKRPPTHIVADVSHTTKILDVSVRTDVKGVVGPKRFMHNTTIGAPHPGRTKPKPLRPAK